MFSYCLAIWLEEQGSPSGVARRVILRDLKLGSNWSSGYRVSLVSVFQFFDLRLAQIQIRFDGRTSTI